MEEETSKYLLNKQQLDMKNCIHAIKEQILMINSFLTLECYQEINLQLQMLVQLTRDVKHLPDRFVKFLLLLEQFMELASGFHGIRMPEFKAAFDCMIEMFLLIQEKLKNNESYRAIIC